MLEQEKKTSSVQMAGVRLHQELTAFIPMYSARITLRLPFLERQGKAFEYEEPVALINPRVEIEGYAINNRGYVNYKIYADDIISVDELADTGVKQ